MLFRATFASCLVFAAGCATEDSDPLSPPPVCLARGGCKACVSADWGKPTSEIIEYHLNNDHVSLVTEDVVVWEEYLDPIPDRPGHFKPLRRAIILVSCAAGTSATSVAIYEDDNSEAPDEYVAAPNEQLVITACWEEPGRYRRGMVLWHDTVSNLVRYGDGLKEEVAPGVPPPPSFPACALPSASGP